MAEAEEKKDKPELPEDLGIYDLRVEEYSEADGKMILVMRRFVRLEDYEELYKKYKPAKPEPHRGTPLRRPEAGHLPAPAPPPRPSNLPSSPRPGVEPLKKK